MAGSGKGSTGVLSGGTAKGRKTAKKKEKYGKVKQENEVNKSVEVTGISSAGLISGEQTRDDKKAMKVNTGNKNWEGEKRLVNKFVSINR